jgi:hypothetical protein
MPTVNRVTEINAPASTVWKILADTPAYPQWNPFMTRLDGTFQPGAKLTVTIEPPGSKPQTFKPTVTEVESGRRVSWLGRLLMPGIFDGAHHLTVEPLSTTRSRFTQSETFTGVLVPLFRSLLKNTDAGFAAMNAALAARAEQDIPPTQ